MRAVSLALSAMSLVALAVGGCGEKPLPPEARGTIAVPPGPQPTGAAAPLVAPTHPYETSAITQDRQEQTGYFADAGGPLVQESTTYSSSAHFVAPGDKRGVLVASNRAVYSNPLWMKRPDLYEDPTEYHAWVASQTQALAGGTAPPATAPVSRESGVYFDWNQATITPEGSQVIDQLANQMRSDNAAQIAIVGKADLSGTDAYNLRLSERRADAVRNRLVADGVTADRIDTRWVGDREPPVPTARGVREARNRVAEMRINTLVGGTAPPQAIVLPRRVLWTTTENFPPGVGGQELPGGVANSSTMGAVGGP